VLVSKCYYYAFLRGKEPKNQNVLLRGNAQENHFPYLPTGKGGEVIGMHRVRITTYKAEIYVNVLILISMYALNDYLQYL
jgi:hypothetical protein